MTTQSRQGINTVRLMVAHARTTLESQPHIRLPLITSARAGRHHGRHWYAAVLLLLPLTRSCFSALLNGGHATASSAG